MSRAVPIGVIALIAFLVSTPLLLVNTGGKAIHNGDEAIYAEFAREMVESGRWSELTWQGEPQLQRPPLAVWLVAAARRIVPDERAIRWTEAAAAGAEVALVILLGAALFGTAAGLVAGGLLLTADLFIGYARYFETEPFLCAFVVAAFLCWQKARTRPGFAVGWGICLGLALMTKQVIGGLPLLAPLCDLAALPRAERIGRRWIGLGLGACGLVWLPWHVMEIARHGRAFVEVYFVENVIARSQSGMLRITRPTFYLRELWRSEGPMAIVFAAGVASAVWSAVKRRAPVEVLLSAWALLPLAVFSASASRYDHYLLLVYPALALSTARLLSVTLPIRPLLRAAIALTCIASAAAAHLPRDLSTFDGDEETRALLRIAAEHHAPPERLYLYNLHAYSARANGPFDVTTLLESPADFRIAGELKRTGMATSVALAIDLPATLASLPRPFLLLMPRARAALLRGVPLHPLAETDNLLLLEGG